MVAGSGEAVMLTARSAAGLTVVKAVAVLLAELRSGSFAETVATLVRVPARVGTTTRVMTARPLLVSAPRSQTTLPAEIAQDPCEFVAKTNVAFARSTFVNMKTLAAFGPRL